MPFKTLRQRFFKSPKRVKTPTLLQMEAVECGAASLGIILAHYRRIVPLAELRHACGVSRDGSKASHILQAARHYGLDAKGFKTSLASVRKTPLPCIVFWEFNHFLVLEGFGPDRVYLNDPASGPRTVSWNEFDHGFTGVVLVFQPGPDFQPGGRKPSLTLALWQRLRPAIAPLLYCFLAGLLLVLPGIVTPVFSQIFIDQILIENRTEWLRPLLLGMGIVLIVQGLLQLLQLRYLRQLQLKLAVGMSTKFLWHLLQLPVSFYGQRFAGEISARMRLNDKVATVLSGQLTQTLIDGIMVVFFAAVMVTYDWQLTAIGVGFAIANLIALHYVSRQRIDANLQLVHTMGKVTNTEIAGLRSIETIKSSASESDFFTRWSGYYAHYLNTQQALSIPNRVISILPILLNALTTLLILLFGGLRVINGNLTIGMLIAFQSLMRSFQAPITRLVNFGSLLQELEGDLTRLDDILQNPTDPTLTVTPSAPAPSPEPPQGHLEFRNVTFGYSPVDPPLIQNLSFTLAPGQRIALVGSSGSGKSTIARLAAGLYQPWAGEILMDGHPLPTWPRALINQALALVEQDIFLFAGTIRDNLTLWDPTCPDAHLIQACQDADIQDVIDLLPGGLDGALLEGAANLSGGQRQRLEIARALVNAPAILILDEATSALDAETEYRVAQNLWQRGCTCLIVAHRLSTIRDSDEIIVLHQGAVLERGTHAKLWPQQGPYAHLIRTEGDALTLAPSSSTSPPTAAPPVGPSPPERPLAPARRRDRDATINHQALHSALEHLSCLSSTAPTEQPIGSPILIAMGAIGHALGVQIHAPPSQAFADPLESLAQIAHASQLRMRRVTLSATWWQRDCGPLLAYTYDQHPVALLPQGAQRYQLFDPQTRSYTPINTNTAPDLAPDAFTFYPALPEQLPNARTLLRFALGGQARTLLSIVLTGLVATLLGMIPPLAIGLLIDQAIPNANRSLLLQLGLALGAAAFGTALFQLTQSLITLRLETRAEAKAQAGLWDRLLKLKVAFFRRYAIGDLQARITAAQRIRQSLGGVTLLTLFTSVFSLLNLALLFYYSAALAWVAVAIAIATLVITLGASIAIRRTLRQLLERQGTLFGFVVQLLGGVTKLRSSGAEPRAFAAWAKAYRRQMQLTLRKQQIEDWVSTVNLLWPTISLIVLFGLAISLQSPGGAIATTPTPGLSTGTFLAFSVAFTTFITGATELSNTLLNTLDVGILWERVQPILATPPEVDQRNAYPGPLSGRIAIEQLSFRYRDGSPLVLNAINLHANPGEFIAIVGPSGSGKSTLLRLLLGFETPASGTILYDGQNLAGLDITAVRRQLGVVLQNGTLNTASIYENIAGGALISLMDAEHAAHMAGLAEDIAALPMGLHTIVSEGGSNLSGGQQQRLLIARALARHPRLLLFDEATSALDNRTQEIVTQSLESLNVTRLVIAHRLSTIRNADRIYVLDQGQVSQVGDFETLAAQEGLFAQLMARQMT